MQEALSWQTLLATHLQVARARHPTKRDKKKEKNTFCRQGTSVDVHFTVHLPVATSFSTSVLCPEHPALQKAAFSNVCGVTSVACWSSQQWQTDALRTWTCAPAAGTDGCSRAPLALVTFCYSMRHPGGHYFRDGGQTSVLPVRRIDADDGLCTPWR